MKMSQFVIRRFLTFLQSKPRADPNRDLRAPLIRHRPDFEPLW